MHSLASDSWYLALIHGTYLFFFAYRAKLQTGEADNVIISFGLRNILRRNNALSQSGLLLSVLGNVLHCFRHNINIKKKMKVCKNMHRYMYDVDFLIVLIPWAYFCLIEVFIMNSSGHAFLKTGLESKQLTLAVLSCLEKSW